MRTRPGCSAAGGGGRLSRFQVRNGQALAGLDDRAVKAFLASHRLAPITRFTKRDPKQVRDEIDQVLQADASAPFGGLAGEKFVNVLQLNLALRSHYGAPQ